MKVKNTMLIDFGIIAIGLAIVNISPAFFQGSLGKFVYIGFPFTFLRKEVGEWGGINLFPLAVDGAILLVLSGMASGLLFKLRKRQGGKSQSEGK